MDGVVDENTFGMAFSMSGLVDYVSVSCFQKVFTCVIPQFVAMDLLLYFNVCFRGVDCICMCTCTCFTKH